MKKLILILTFAVLLTGCGENQTIEERREVAELCDDLKLDIEYNTNPYGEHWVSCK